MPLTRLAWTAGRAAAPTRSSRLPFSSACVTQDTGCQRDMGTARHLTPGSRRFARREVEMAVAGVPPAPIAPALCAMHEKWLPGGNANWAESARDRQFGHGAPR